MPLRPHGHTANGTRRTMFFGDFARLGSGGGHDPLWAARLCKAHAGRVVGQARPTTAPLTPEASSGRYGTVGSLSALNLRQRPGSAQQLLLMKEPATQSYLHPSPPVQLSSRRVSHSTRPATAGPRLATSMAEGGSPRAESAVVRAAYDYNVRRQRLKRMVETIVDPRSGTVPSADLRELGKLVGMPLPESLFRSPYAEKYAPAGEPCRRAPRTVLWREFLTAISYPEIIEHERLQAIYAYLTAYFHHSDHSPALRQTAARSIQRRPSDHRSGPADAR